MYYLKKMLQGQVNFDNFDDFKEDADSPASACLKMLSFFQFKNLFLKQIDMPFTS